MKRKYITPATEQIKVSAMSMMATSNIMNKDGNLEGGFENDYEVLSRDDNPGNSFNIWENEW